ncbi:DUF2786 domain-containing protein [Corynebacterium sp. Q4381]|uniref:DUF2786 domain-containing protein n=1 Tax=Corynebacterium sp. Marseille-Q4381 TaxID=3121597 RepID=UPI002FE5A82B
MQNIDKIKEKVQKLLNQAADRQGTPEGDSFYDKAFTLMATYGFDERDLTALDEGDRPTYKTYTFSGSYTDMQSRLLHAIAGALHCTGFHRSASCSTRVKEATIFGLGRHLERVDMLYSLLLPVMMAKARGLQKESEFDSLVVSRRSFMAGFAHRIAERLQAAEETVASSNEGYGLVLVGDLSAAQTARDEYAVDHGLAIGAARASKRSLDPAAFFQGQDAGSMTDIGQTRVQARPALPC